MQGVGNVDHQRKVVAKRSRKDGSEHLGNFKLKHNLNNPHFKNKIMFENHSLLNRKRKLLKCSWCSFESDRKFNLERHIFIHTKRKVFKPSECNSACNQEANQNAHILKHNNDKIFKCYEGSYGCNNKESDYECSSKDYLTRHVSPTKLKLYKCSDCNFECEHETYLRRHMFVHGKSKILKCSDCRYESRSESYLKRHYLTHKKKKETEWVWSYKENEYLMECYYIGEAILAKTEKMELGNYVKEEKVKPNDFMEYMFNLKYSNLDRKTLVKQKHRILFNVIKERQEYKKKVLFPSEEDLERIKAKAKHFVENEFEPSRKLITKIKENVQKLNKKKKKIAKA